MSIILIHPYPGRPEADVRLSGILSHALADREGRTIRTAEELDLRPGDRVPVCPGPGQGGTEFGVLPHALPAAAGARTCWRDAPPR